VDGRGGLSSRTVRYTHAVIYSALKQALKEQLIARNVAEAVVLPAQQKKEIRPLTTEEVHRLLSAAKDDRLYPAFLLELGSGLRRGELLGLRWQDVDLKAGVITVRQSLIRTRAGLVFQEPKTERSKRNLPLPPAVVRELKAHRARQAEEKLLLGPDYEDRGLVFCLENGKPLDPRNFTRHFELLLKKAGLPHVRFHDLRHTHATQLLGLGVHAKIVQERLGHTTISTTLDTYSHAVPGLQEEAARKLDALLMT